MGVYRAHISDLGFKGLRFQGRGLSGLNINIVIRNCMSYV